MKVSLVDLGIVCSLGTCKQQVLDNCLNNHSNHFVLRDDLHPHKAVWVGQVSTELPNMQSYSAVYQNRCNQLLLLAYQQIQQRLQQINCPQHKLAVVIGTSTSGIATGENAMRHKIQHGEMPTDFDYAMQEMGAPAQFVAHLSGATGPAYGISTACSSSAKAIISAYHLLQSGMVDVVIAGGVDSLCQLTSNGFSALESVSQSQCKPFSDERDGISIGEGAALFIMQRQANGIVLEGFAEGSDAYHISAPCPDGSGAIRVMQQAMLMAQLNADSIDYINLHGTGTIKNDEMEANAVHSLLRNVPCSSTKGKTGHTLGAAGAIEAGICWLLMSDLNRLHQLPANSITYSLSSHLQPINLLTTSAPQTQPINSCLSNSFAFGGSNASLLLVRDKLCTK
ncbi:beta-ketoacyl-ACP synthase [Alteromonadaceae bacterium BrNp21-10]|nr:beta-ketoacyl-ACP synthase [Alteromonadaceae bacterium BrNp21-10]